MKNRYSEVSHFIQNLSIVTKPYERLALNIRGIPFSTYVSTGRWGVKSPILFHCVLHAKRGEGGPDSM